jgi:SAM-dependent methyltransferase
MKAGKCYLCGGVSFTPRKGTVRDDPALEILECDACHLVTLSSLGHIKPGHYEDSGMHAGQEKSVESWRRDGEVDDQRRFKMLKSAMANRRILDFGAGAAGFLLKARAVATEAAGIEPERRVRDLLGKEITLYGSLDELKDAKFDLITAFHVVEHLSDPRAILSALARRLAPGGRLIIEVPSSDDALLTLFDCEPFQNFTYWSQHLFLFNAETLRRVGEQAGLRVIAVQYVQRYPLSNHLQWLSKGRPGGHRDLAFLDGEALNAAYAAALASIGKTDTIIMHLASG